MSEQKPEPPSFVLNRVFGPSLDPLKTWYLIHNSLMANGRKEDFLSSDVFSHFSGEILKVSIEGLTGQNGGRVITSQRKKDMVVVATLFSLLARSL